MEGLLTFLLFAGAFFLMMRFGCGAHMKHGNPHDRIQQDTTGDVADNDPVCGMPVASGQGFALMHQGRQYHFCSRHCFDKFAANPLRYVSNPNSHESHAGDHHE